MTGFRAMPGSGAPGGGKIGSGLLTLETAPAMQHAADVKHSRAWRG